MNTKVQKPTHQESELISWTIVLALLLAEIIMVVSLPRPVSAAPTNEVMAGMSGVLKRREKSPELDSGEDGGDVFSVVDMTEAATIDASFDSASIDSYTIDGNVISFTLRVDELGYKYWTNFTVSGVLNDEITFNITGVEDVNFLANQTHENQMVYSCDGESWQRLTQHSYSSNNEGTYTFIQTFPCGDAQIAIFFPFDYQTMQDYLDTIEASMWATKTSLGVSHQGRPLDLLTITNTAIPTANKRIIYIIGRQHSAVTSSSHMLEGMIDFLVSSDTDAQRMRDNFIWYFVPMVNPDGVYLGKSRETSEGNDPNRDWHWDNDDTVEITRVRDHIESINSTYGIDMFIDWHSQMNDERWYNFVYAPPENDFYSVLSSWTDFDSQNTSGTSCSLNSCTSRGYTTVKLDLFNFVFEPSPHLVTWTEASLQEQGVLTAYAIDQYFGACDTAIAPTGVVINRIGGTDDIELTWPDTGSSYEIWQGTIPYFLPGDGHPGTQSLETIESPPYLVNDGVGDAATNYFFLVRGINDCGNPSLDISNRVGEFDFMLVVPQS
jgi:hypothetical protein